LLSGNLTSHLFKAEKFEKFFHPLGVGLRVGWYCLGRNQCDAIRCNEIFPNGKLRTIEHVFLCFFIPVANPLGKAMLGGKLPSRLKQTKQEAATRGGKRCD
jgi:hypothetical protein